MTRSLCTMPLSLHSLTKWLLLEWEVLWTLNPNSRSLVYSCSWKMCQLVVSILGDTTWCHHYCLERKGQICIGTSNHSHWKGQRRYHHLGSWWHSDFPSCWFWGIQACHATFWVCVRPHHVCSKRRKITLYCGMHFEEAVTNGQELCLALAIVQLLELLNSIMDKPLLCEQQIQSDSKDIAYVTECWNLLFSNWIGWYWVGTWQRRIETVVAYRTWIAIYLFCIVIECPYSFVWQKRKRVMIIDSSDILVEYFVN